MLIETGVLLNLFCLDRSLNQEVYFHQKLASNQIKATICIITIKFTGLENLCKKDDKYDSKICWFPWHTTWH